MKKNPVYKIYLHNHKRVDGTSSIRIVAASHFEGRTVKGYADCHPEDNFDMKYGVALATARCAEKIAAKRCRRAVNKVLEAEQKVQEALQHFNKMSEYMANAEIELDAASEEVESLLAEKYKD